MVAPTGRRLGHAARPPPPAQRPPSTAPTPGPRGSGPEAEPGAARGTRPRQRQAAGGPEPRRKAFAGAGLGPREPGLRRAPRHPERFLSDGWMDGWMDGPPPAATAAPLSTDSGRRRSGTGSYHALGPPGSARRSPGTRTLWADGPPAHRKCPSVLRNAHSMGRWSSSSPEVPVGPPERALYGPMVLQLTGSARRSSGTRTLWADGPPAHRKCPSLLRNAHFMGRQSARTEQRNSKQIKPSSRLHRGRAGLRCVPGLCQRLNGALLLSRVPRGHWGPAPGSVGPCKGWWGTTGASGPPEVLKPSSSSRDEAELQG
ncbi:uncharacterized protein [Ciconia boyciana]|uniref:uncharacterized protein isoform X2 n=1 Tax=Ciconia boyciana TaxID=52775 RepID=UPI003BA0B875